ncbi:cytidine deaminase [Asticcacaulis excentricus]|uniref:Cytidine deaminase n=1 Tax=Asticcacaulis excentricus (strain ATCC 15261 / DSM 4724 / KCTC 12464 / NCIMB 9791 / VKM B-1370 / CB 48) TaxID=573065 RepID=E8RKM6_ASTEC|nr:cytidine deaminase [Asticcacaulis excentricus]ADU13560.1 cytidine deaminase [Asticcacaulis excentricus CB 48]
MSHDLFDAAKAAAALSHSPYSGFPVGAAIRTPDGRIFSGTNVENLSFPQGWCAETSALAQMIMGGAKEVAEIAIFAPKKNACPPCGGCRQKLAEFSDGSARIHLCDETGVVQTVTLAELLPMMFRTKLK